MATTIDGIPVGGSVGKVTYGRNRAGSYTRRRTKPVNPNSALQQSARFAFRAAVNAWTNTLTSIQRSGWNTYAAGTPWFNRAGEPMRLTGQQAFIRTYSFYYYGFNSAPPTLVAPGTFNTGSIAGTNTSLTYDVSANTLAYIGEFPLEGNTWQVEDGNIQILVSQPTNPSVNFRPNRFSYLTGVTVGAVPASTISPGAVPSPYVCQTGQRLWVKVRGLHPDNRLTTELLLGPTVVTVVP